MSWSFFVTFILFEGNFLTFVLSQCSVFRMSHQRCSIKEGVPRNVTKFTGMSTLIKKETLAQVFSCEFCETSQNIFFYRTLLDDCFCVLNKLSEYIYTFTYQKALLRKLFCLFLKLSKAFSKSLNTYNSDHLLCQNQVSRIKQANVIAATETTLRS